MNALPPGLEDLLRALRAAGLPVGAREVLRLHRTFELEPALAQEREPGAQLRDLLLCALVHSPPEREVFDQVYGPWSERWQSWDQVARPEEPARRPVPETRPLARRRRFAWRQFIVAGQLIAVAMAVGLLLPPRPPPPVPVPVVTGDGDPGRESPVPPGETPEVSIHPMQFVPAGTAPAPWPFPFLLFGGLSLLAAGLLGWRFRRRPWIPEPMPEATLPGPARLPLLPLAETGPELLDGDGARTMIWGVGRHLTEDLTTEVDLDETVDRTAAAGGIPELRFERDRRLREVWLWVDGTVEEPALQGFCEEIATSLEEAGLPVRIGGFEGYPLVLRWDEGQRFRPEEVEGHRQTALVAVCTDGRVLLSHRLGSRQERVRALLRALAAWPRLVFVDFSPPGSGLAAELRPYGISCIEPEALPAFLGLGSTTVPARPAEDPGELRAWAAALALSPRPVGRRCAYALRRELGLAPSPWSLPQLSDQGAAPLGGRLAWSPEARREHLRWLGASEPVEGPGIRAGGLLDRALAFWERRFEEEDRERCERGEVEAWEERPARRYLHMERALLQLWRQPAEAAEALFEVRQDELAEVIRTHLERFTPWDCRRPGDERIRLPWRLADQSDRVRYLLAELGLGGVAKGRLRWPGRLGLGLGILAGLGALVLGAGLLGQGLPRDRPTGGQLVEVDEDSADDLAGMRFAEIPGGTFLMGAADDDPYATPDEQPAHRVEITGFRMGVTEVTNAQYRWYRPDQRGADEKPAVYVSWAEARRFCRSLGESESWEYDLPTEAEWEYAARAGTQSLWSFGNDEERLGDYAWFRGNSGIEAHPVATREANPWGLFDMHGNVWEWVLDCYDPDLYGRRAGKGTVRDPVEQCPETPGALRVVRGGSYWNEPGRLRSADRNWGGPVDRDEVLGFRGVRRPRRQLDPLTP